MQQYQFPFYSRWYFNKCAPATASRAEGAGEVQGYLSRPEGNDGGGSGQRARNATQAGGRAGDEETQRLSWKTQGTGGSPQAGGDGRERRAGKPIDWKTHLLSVWHSTPYKSSLAWRTIWWENGRAVDVKDIKRNETQSERELTGRGGVARVSLREINISWAFFFPFCVSSTQQPASVESLCLCSASRQQPNKTSRRRNIVIINVPKPKVDKNKATTVK